MERSTMARRARAAATLAFGTMALAPLPAQAQRVLVTADGPGETYERLDSFGFGLETPDCGHSVRHVREVFDTTLNRHVFAFDAHVSGTVDSDRCSNFDRQRMEVKTAPGHANQGILQHAQGQTAFYRWKFKLPSGFQPSPNFTHIFQIKAQAGSDAGAPLVTITPRQGSPNQLEVIWTAPGGANSKVRTSLAPFINTWVEASVQYRSADSGNVQLTLRRLSDGASLITWNSGTVDTWRSGNNYNRGKWGIYRSLDTISALRNETVLFADWCISETSFSDCPSEAGGGGGGGGGDPIRVQAESMAKTNYETNEFEGATCARATGGTLGNVRTIFNGTSGTHDISVRYHDENDGAATFTLRVAGAVIGSWTANINDHTWKIRTFTGVSVANGAEIRVESARESGEHARVDWVEIR